MAFLRNPYIVPIAMLVLSALMYAQCLADLAIAAQTFEGALPLGV